MDLISACKKGNKRQVQFLVENGIDVRQTDRYGKNGFHWGCIFGHKSIVEYLTSIGIDIYTVEPKNGVDGFFWACNLGHFEIVKFLSLHFYDISKKMGRYNRSGFHTACANGFISIVKFLMVQGYDFTTTDRFGLSGFHLACYKGHIEIVKYFIQNGYNIKTKAMGKNARNGFHLACSQGHHDVCRLLINQDCDINSCDAKGRTGLHHVFKSSFFFQKHRKTVNLLMSFDCNINAKDHKGKIAIDNCINDLTTCLLALEHGSHMGQIDIDIIDMARLRLLEMCTIKKYTSQNFCHRIAFLITQFTIESFTDKNISFLKKLLQTNPNYGWWNYGDDLKVVI